MKISNLPLIKKPIRNYLFLKYPKIEIGSSLQFTVKPHLVEHVSAFLFVPVWISFYNEIPTLKQIFGKQG